jgi:hypothetical protein
MLQPAELKKMGEIWTSPGISDATPLAAPLTWTAALADRVEGLQREFGFSLR